MEERRIGFVQFWDRGRGFGFIVPLGGEEPVHVQLKDLEGDCKSLSTDQQVTFVLALGAGRFEARRVRP